MMDNLTHFGPVFAFVWIVTIACILLMPQRFFNSFLLMVSILITMLFIAGFLKREDAAVFLLVCFVLVMLTLLLVPIMLVMNGIVMIRRESLSAAHILSLVLGLVVGIGEVASIVFVLSTSEIIGLESTNGLMLFLSFTIFYFSFLILSFVLYASFIQLLPHKMNFNYVIIHGCGLAGGERITKLLQNRVDRAVQIYRQCKVKPMLIPSGGQGPDEKLSEAQAMKDYLLTRNIPEEHIIMEDRSTTTRENLSYSKAIIEAREGGKKTALVSSNYHIFRCLRIARKNKFKCIGIGALVAFYYWPSALIREFIAVFLTKGFFIWSMIGYLIFISPVLLILFSS